MKLSMRSCRVTNSTISKWARALRYVAQFKDPSTRLKAFMTEAGGVNACADRYAKYFGRGGRCQSRRHSAPSPRWRFQQLSSPKWPARMRSNTSIQLAAGSLLPKALQLIEHVGYIALAIPTPRRTPSASRSSARLISCRADQVLGTAFANARFYFRSRAR